ncbi:type I DNA topoisomerase [candidate division WWE3 bacterium CG08_land_8_20_14_0_20_43_13]|uniref:DNA topoisomerase 1 n=1 Tax=candidate division WWE3 bacterium CG08_land_8_20_14_0_20_43_13 TaxID=1975087 RepID=A0A2H0X6W9_UNCKA|nr:MAG: type I DNA topoisomerase [candidate division WWE3 bacterium CG08_land_8_20_14_0_20_43_13]
MKLVIVESPAKTKTLGRYLGDGYQVEASVGHVRDLPKKGMGIDIDHDFTPLYDIVEGKTKVVSLLRKAASEASEVYLAMDPDREGEAIAWHVAYLLAQSKKKVPPVKRVTFNEITEEAVLESFKNPRIIDQDLVDAQQARRVLDRLVGYKLSPLLWKKVRFGLSAGRVQSVALRLVVEREKERQSFDQQVFFTLAAKLSGGKKKEDSFEAQLLAYQGKTVEVKTSLDLFAGPYTFTSSIFSQRKDLDKVVLDIKGKDFVVDSIQEKEGKLYPKPPFITSTMQQEASWRLGLSPHQTMRAAQSLYEHGLITYMRTDSTNLSQKAVGQVRFFIKDKYGDEYLPAKPIFYKTKSKQAQEAHEAIRPTATSVFSTSAKVAKLGKNQEKVYNMIWQRFVACQMNPAKSLITSVDISAGEAIFRARGLRVTFAGFLKAYPHVEKDTILPKLSVGQKMVCHDLLLQERQTTPPPRYSQAGLIKELERFGVGRPSTYATIIETLKGRRYVMIDNKQIVPEDVAVVVSDLLSKHFPQVVDIGFTADMEDDLDKVAQGEKTWVPLVKEFYGPFSKNLELKELELKKTDVTTLEITDQKCPQCGKPLAVKLGKYGRFLSCTGWPDCKVAISFNSDGKAIDETQIKEPCPLCGEKMELKEGRFGKFLACTKYPKCKGTKAYLDKIGVGCPKCEQGDVVIKRTKRGRVFYGCSRYPDCDYSSWKDPRQDEKTGGRKTVKSKPKS